MEPKVISGIQFSSLPSSYIRPESQRPKLSEVVECDNVPIVDLGCGDRSLIIKQIGDACREYGFFQVTSLPPAYMLLLKAQSIHILYWIYLCSFKCVVSGDKSWSFKGGGG